MSEELKPCPCCGSDEIAEGYDTEGNSAFTCEGCGLGTAWEPTAVSRAAWNRRAPMTAHTPAGERDEAIEAAKRVQAFDPTFPNYAEWDDGYTDDAKIIARALLSSPDARREALEEAAQIAEAFAERAHVALREATEHTLQSCVNHHSSGIAIAAQIRRALKENKP